MTYATLDRIGVPDDDGDNMIRIGIGEAELHANNGPAPEEGAKNGTKEVQAALGQLATTEEDSPLIGRRAIHIPRHNRNRSYLPHMRNIAQPESRFLGGLTTAQLRNLS